MLQTRFVQDTERVRARRARILRAAFEEQYDMILPVSGVSPARFAEMEPSPDDTLTIVRVSRFSSSG